MATESRALKNFRANLERLIAERSSQRELAAAIGMSRPHLNRLLRGRHDCMMGTAERIAEALDVTLETMLADPGKKISRRSA